MFSEVIKELGDVDHQCVSWIGQEQRCTIESMKVEIESLRSQLKERDDYIAVLEQSQAKLRQVENTVGNAIARLTEKNKGDRRLQGLAKRDLNSQIATLLNFTQGGTVIDDKDSKILASMLRGHVEFLTRLAATPDLQSLFLVSQNTGRTFLSEATKDLVLEQATRTSKFLEEIGKGDRSASPFGSVREILDLGVDSKRRIDDITKVVEGSDISTDALKSVLLNEVTLTSALRRYATALLKKRDSSTKEPDLLSNTLKSNRRSQCNTELEDFRRRTPGRAKPQDTNQWVTWAKKLYRALTGLPPDFEAAALQMAIEEAALTSVGSVRT